MAHFPWIWMVMQGSLFYPKLSWNNLAFGSEWWGSQQRGASHEQGGGRWLSPIPEQTPSSLPGLPLSVAPGSSQPHGSFWVLPPSLLLGRGHHGDAGEEDASHPVAALWHLWVQVRAGGPLVPAVSGPGDLWTVRPCEAAGAGGPGSARVTLLSILGIPDWTRRRRHPSLKWGRARPFRGGVRRGSAGREVGRAVPTHRRKLVSALRCGHALRERSSLVSTWPPLLVDFVKFLFIFFFPGCAGSSLRVGSPLVAARGGLLWCKGFSLRGRLLFSSASSRACGLQQLQSPASRAQAQ